MRPSFSRLSLSIALAVAAVQVAPPSFAQDLHFDIPAQPAASGIKSFAKQAGIQILVSGEAANGKTLNKVQGDLDTRAALDRLISGSGLKVQSCDGSTAVLVRDTADKGNKKQAVRSGESMTSLEAVNVNAAATSGGLMSPEDTNKAESDLTAQALAKMSPTTDPL